MAAAATPVEFTAECEGWNVYQLADGTTLRLRVMLVRIGRLPKSEDGKIPYSMHWQVVSDVEMVELPEPQGLN